MTWALMRIHRRATEHAIAALPLLHKTVSAMPAARFLRSLEPDSEDSSCFVVTGLLRGQVLYECSKVVPWP